MSHEKNQPEQLLDQAIDALQQREYPEGRPPGLPDALLNEFDAQRSEPVESTKTFWKRIKTMPTWTRVAAVLVLGAMISIAILPLGGNNKVLALAAVLKKVEQAEGATFILKLKVQGQKEFTINQTIADSGWVINELAGMTIITDLNKRMSLQLVHGLKEAYLIDITRLPEAQRPKDILTQVKRVDPEKAKFLRKETLNGRETLVYDISEDYGQCTMWVDVKSELPVRYHIIGEEGKKQLEMTADSFDWNPKLDRSKFTLKVPEGYKVKELAIPESQVNAMVEFLRTWSTMDNGSFPDALTPVSLSSVNSLFMDPNASPEDQLKQAKVNVAKLLGKEKVTEEDFNSWRHEFMQTAIGVSVLLSELAGDKDRKFHWHGKGVKFGDKNKPIAWWRIKDKETYLMIYADLSSKEVPAGDVPKIEAPKEAIPEEAVPKE